VAAKEKACAELEVNQRWQELRDCAVELAILGERDRIQLPKAEEFRQEAVKETASALANGKFKEAIDAGNLREAQKQLKAIPSDSVYFPAASEALHTAEAKAVDDNRRKAQALLAKRDCAGVKRLHGTLTAASTTVVASAVAAVAAKCGAGSSPPIDLGGAAGDHAGATSPCEPMNVDDTMTQAQNQYTAGFAKAALSLVVKALACRQDVRMYRFAATYACAAHDVAAAKLYYGKVPSQFRAAILQRCQQEGIAVP
jgi:hypothetical protein